MATALKRQAAVRFIRDLTRYWALLGGLVILGVVAANVYSVALIMLFNRPFPGVYEIVQVGTAVGMFMFLPYCQVTGSNVTADIFTSGMGRRTVVALAGLGAACGVAFAGILLWRMSYGLIDQMTYRETTAIYQFPLWYAYIPILVSLALFVLAGIANLMQSTYGVVPEEAESA
ncbi:MAG TPA: TRAP transporter small permease [Pelagibacterium sp.]|uniref:TRAP transporter small permease n=1 Tax=Pelagibacterium sp. TaxID=1967288 RepID=UPI002C88E1F0|nr:TRAP transporter small permease [Pelagibacterium sp.]HWJ87202.1 TRAP transporter small permease [Pelagibacterium sp.]